MDIKIIAAGGAGVYAIVNGVPVILAAGGASLGYILGEMTSLGGNPQAFVDAAEKQAQDYARARWEALSAQERALLVPSYQGGQPGTPDFNSAREKYENAFEHAYVSARMQQAGAPYLAELLGTAREYLDPFTPDTYKDLWNNRLGRELANANPNFSEGQLLDYIHDNLGDKNGNGTIDEGEYVTEPNSAPVIDPSGAIAIQAQALAKVLLATGWVSENVVRPAWTWFEATPPGRYISDLIDEAVLLYKFIMRFDSPLVLDLDGNGIDLVSVSSDYVAYFDHNGNGFATATGWTAGVDGFLVLDLNEDGIINDGTELFGNQTGYDNGFLALSSYDSNNDEQITAEDQIWETLRVWVDVNQNGFSEESELHTLSSLLITSISLSYTEVSYEIEGNEVRQVATFVINGDTRDIVDVYFQTNTLNSTYIGDYELDVNALFVPALRGYGLLPDFYITASMDNDLEDENSLLSLLTELSEQSIEDIFDEAGATKDFVRAILFRWAGVDDVDPESRGRWADARELGFLEKMTGQPYLQLGWSTNPLGPNGGGGVKESFKLAFNHFYAVLLAQTAAGEVFTGDFYYNIATDSIVGITGLDTDTLDALEGLASALSSTAERKTFWSDVVRMIEFTVGTSNLDSGSQYALESAISGSDISLNLVAIVQGLTAPDPVNLITGGLGASEDTLTGTEGADFIRGFAGDDALYGMGGHDTLEGGAGNDLLVGGEGSDLVQGGSGDDVYVYNLGDGWDTFIDSSGNDKILFGAGISAEHLTLTRVGNNDLMIAIDTGTQVGSILVQNQFTTNGAIETIEFADGSTLDLAAYGNWVIMGTDYNDWLYGVDSPAGNEDTIFGGAGVDRIWGYEGNDELHGGAGNDSIYGGNGADVLFGDAGNDSLDGGAGADTMSGGTGDDTYFVDNAGDTVIENADEGTDTVVTTLNGYVLSDNVENLTLAGSSAISGTGNSLDNILIGNGAVNTLTGGAGNDVLNGKGGNDRLVGGTGDDTYIIDNTGVTIVENASEGIDTVRSSLSTYTLGTNLENLILTGTGNITGIGNALDNTLIGNSGNNVLNGGTGADTMIGGKGNDTYTVDNVGDVIVELEGEGIDSVTASVSYTLSDNVENLTFTGSAALVGTGNALDNTLTGNSGANTLYGGAGNDWIDGGTGVDTMFGGTGDDTFVVNVATDVVVEYADEGIDTVRSAVTYTLADNIENLIITGTTALNGTGNALDNVLIGGSGANILYGLEGNDTLDGGLGNDTLVGGLGDDTYIVNAAGDVIVENVDEGIDTVLSTAASYTLGANVEILHLLEGAVSGTGNAIANTIIGNSGNNTLDGGAGVDTLIGGLGNDTYIVDEFDDVIVEGENEGIDTVQAALNGYVLGANLENLTLTGTALIGSGNADDNVLTGNASANTLYGFSGNDTLNGMTGADTLVGGLGDDYYIVDNVGDVVIENADEGIDTVQSSVSYTLANNVENLILTGSGALSGTGNALDNTLIGNTGVNILNGGDGNDYIDGGAGADTMIGGLGDDTFVVSVSTDVIIENADEGIDTVVSGLSTYTLGNNLENLTLTGTGNIIGIGNALNNVLTGNSGNNTLNGGVGADTMIGGLGNDVYIVDDEGDVIIEYGGEGIDTVQSSAANYTVGANVEIITLTGTGNINITGNDGDNTITGNSGVNILSGAGGNDTLNGGSGADTMIGGVGNDIYIVDNAGDVVIENENEGIDTVQASVSYTLSDHVENLTLTGSAALTGTGNDLDNTLFGNSGANILIGGAGNDYLNGGPGNDTMLGGIGNDTYVVNVATDVIIENENEGIDTVIASVTWTLGDNLENLHLNAGAGAINGFGNNLNNIIIGNSALNTLSGGAGADTMIGGGGNDVYIVDDEGDVVIENADEGIDTVQSSVTWVLGSHFENLTLTGSLNISGTGNSLNNTITGNAGSNTLDGGAGADVMIGGLGDDTYIVDNVGDVVTEAASAGIDHVLASVSYTLSTNVENLTLTGSEEINGTGNALVNTLIGNNGNNTLNGMAGADTMIGGLGDDYYIVDNVGDVVIESADEGVDTVQSSVTWALGEHFEHLVLTGSSAIDATGNDKNNIIIGNSAKNILWGGAGNDTITGGGGADTMFGGTGDDVYIVSTTTTVINENADEGIDRVESSVTYTLSDNVENLTLTGFAAINATGNAQNNTLVGNAANNTLNGGAGADVMIGGFGDDVYIVDDADDLVVESLNQGIDTVQASVSYTLSAHVENLTLTGSGDIDATGNSLNNVLIGNAGVNVLTGGAGNDTLNGMAGADTMIGGTGNDVYVVDNIGDVIIEYADEGIDTVQTALNGYVLDTHLENLTLTGSAALSGTGNALDNTIIGTTGNNTLIGLEGNDVLDGNGGVDTLIGGVGDDTYYIDSSTDVIIEYADEGIDTVMSSITYTLGANLENLILTGAAALNGTGNALDNTLSGNGGSNTLNGGAGNDYLDSGYGGTDRLVGGDGDDTYRIWSSTTTVVEGSGAGTDTVILHHLFSGGAYTLTSNVENLIMEMHPTLVLHLNATGNALANTMIGNHGNNTLSGGDGDDVLFGNGGNDRLIGGNGNDTLDGGTGADTMDGGNGDDVFIVDNIGDVVIAGAGIDTIYSSVSYTAPANAEHLILTGMLAINATGNALDNTLIGNTASNVLDGGAGNDWLSGGGGLDILTGGLGADTFFFEAATAFSGRDTVTDFNIGEGDVIDISDILSGFYNDGVDDILDFVKFENALNGLDTIVSVDRDGAGGVYGFQQIAILSNVTGLTDEAALVASNNLLVA